MDHAKNLEDIRRMNKRHESLEQLIKDTLLGCKKYDQETARLRLKREQSKQYNDRSSSPESNQDEDLQYLDERLSASQLREEDTDGMTGSNNLGDNTNVEEDNANISQCAETDTEVETDDEEENTDDITDPTRVVEPHSDLENTQVDAPVSNSVSVSDQNSSASQLREEDTDGMTGSNNLGDNTNVEEDNANISQCAETDTEVETDDEEENTDDITDPTRVVEPHSDLENTQDRYLPLLVILSL